MAPTSTTPDGATANDEREAALRQRLDEQPHDADALADLAVLRAQAGHLDEALDLARRAVEMREDDPRLHLIAGGMAGNAGDGDEAVSRYRAVLELRPDSADAHVGLGQIAEARDQLGAAGEHYDAALRSAPQHADALIGKARLAMLSGHAEQSVQQFAKVVQMYPRHARALTGYGQALIERGTPEHAARPLKRALELDDRLLQARLMLAHVELHKGNVQVAERGYREVLQGEPSNDGALAGLGDALRAQNRMDEAWLTYDVARKRRPDAEILTVLRNTCLGAIGREDEAVEDLRAYIAEYPRTNLPRQLLADILRGRGHKDEVEAMWQDAVNTDPEDALAQGELARAFENRGQFDKAVAAAAHSTADKRPAVALMRARLALRNGDPAVAERELLELKNTKLEPDAKRTRLRLMGLVHDRAGRWGEAALAFREAQRIGAGELPSLIPAEQLGPVIEPLLAEPELAHPRVAPPILLLGLPGSAVDRVATLLADQPGLVVRDDRLDARNDFFAQVEDASFLVPLPQSRLGVQARRYARAQERLAGSDAGQVIDWVPILDARSLPVAKLALPGVRAIIVDADPELAYLRWLALGWQTSLRMQDAVAAARWLRLERQQLQLAARYLPTLRIDADALMGDPQANGSDLANFLDLEALQPGPLTQTRIRASAGLDDGFVSGHQKNYRDALGEAFSELD